MYKMGALAYETEHEVRISSYHSQYNPTELIWAQVKEEIG